jgi:hypothetical protein
MHPKVITPDTPCNLVGLRPSNSPARQDYFWIGFTTDGPAEYVEHMVEIAKQDGIGSEALKTAIREVLESGNEVAFDWLAWDFPRREAHEKKLAVIEHCLAAGHPLRNSEVQKIARAKEREEHAEDIAARLAEREEKRRQRDEAQRQRAVARERARIENEMYHWPAAPEGCVTIYAEEEWIDGAEPQVVRVASTKDAAGATNSRIGFTCMAHPFTPQAQRVRDQKARGVRRRLRLLEVHPRAGLKARKDAWARQLGLAQND